MVSIEWLREDVGIARSGPRHRAYGDPYTASLVIDGQGEVAVLKGLCVPVSGEEWRDLEKLLRERGYRYAVWETKRQGGTRTRVRTL